MAKRKTKSKKRKSRGFGLIKGRTQICTVSFFNQEHRHEEAFVVLPFREHTDAQVMSRIRAQTGQKPKAIIDTACKAPSLAGTRRR